MELMSEYVDSVDGLTMQLYRARPRSLFPGAAFVDAIRETLTPYVSTTYQRNLELDIAVIHELFDHGDAADMADRFVDGFVPWVAERFHAAGANTLVEVSAVADDPSYRPDWLPENERRTYFATIITLGGFAAT
jgi:hypothetical protein